MTYVYFVSFLDVTDDAVAWGNGEVRTNKPLHSMDQVREAEGFLICDCDLTEKTRIMGWHLLYTEKDQPTQEEN